MRIPAYWHPHSSFTMSYVSDVRHVTEDVAVAENGNSRPVSGRLFHIAEYRERNYSSAGFIVEYTLVTSSSFSRRSVSLFSVSLCSGVTSFRSTLGILSKPPEMSS